MARNKTKLVGDSTDKQRKSIDPNSLKNLVPWEKGISGNPKGRPKKELPSETLSKMLASQYGAEKIKELQLTMPEPWRSSSEVSVQEIISWVMLKQGMTASGDVARRDTFDRVEGRPKMTISGPKGGPIETVNYDFSKMPTEKIRAIRELLREAAVKESEESEE